MSATSRNDLAEYPYHQIVSHTAPLPETILREVVTVTNTVGGVAKTYTATVAALIALGVLDPPEA